MEINIFASKDKNKEILTKYTEPWSKIKDTIEKINDKPGKQDKKYMQIKFKSANNLHLNKLLKIHILTIVFRSRFQEGNKYYS